VRILDVGDGEGKGLAGRWRYSHGHGGRDGSIRGRPGLDLIFAVLFYSVVVNHSSNVPFWCCRW
jgi:hypothetical protein